MVLKHCMFPKYILTRFIMEFEGPLRALTFNSQAASNDGKAVEIIFACDSFWANTSAVLAGQDHHRQSIQAFTHAKFSFLYVAADCVDSLHREKKKIDSFESA